MIKAVIDPVLRERLISRLVTNDHSGSMREERSNTFVAVVDQCLVARPHEAGAIIIEDCGDLEAAQARYAEICRITYPERFGPKPRAPR